MYGLDNPSWCLNHARLPRSGALLPGMPVFWPPVKSLLELHISPLLSGWQSPKWWAAAHKAFRLFALCALTPKCRWGKYHFHVFICPEASLDKPTSPQPCWWKAGLCWWAHLLVCYFVMWIKPQLPTLKISEFLNEFLPCHEGSCLFC